MLLDLGRLKAIEARNEADFKRELATLKQKYSARNTVDVDSRPMAIADRMTQLETALAEYAEIHPLTRFALDPGAAIRFRRRPQGGLAGCRLRGRRRGPSRRCREWLRCGQ